MMVWIAGRFIWLACCGGKGWEVACLPSSTRCRQSCFFFTFFNDVETRITKMYNKESPKG